jgi:hypothetical protein
LYVIPDEYGGRVVLSDTFKSSTEDEEKTFCVFAAALRVVAMLCDGCLEWGLSVCVCGGEKCGVVSKRVERWEVVRGEKKNER